MDKAVLDLLAFYQKELRESQHARTVLKRLNIAPEAVDHLQLGYSSGAAYKAASEEQKALLRRLDLFHHTGERFTRCLIFPVFNEAGSLVDLYGIRPEKYSLKRILWQQPPRGHIGVQCLSQHPEIILTDHPHYVPHVIACGHLNVIAVRHDSEWKDLRTLLDRHDVRRVFVLSRKCAGKIEKKLKRTGVETIRLAVPADGIVSKKTLEPVGKTPLKTAAADSVELTERTESRLSFTAKDINYRVESLSLAGIGMRVQCRAESGSVSHLDKLDLAAAQSRRKFSRLCGLRLGVSSNLIEDHLSKIADAIDNLLLEQAQAQTRAPRKLNKSEESEALSILRSENVLEYQAQALEAESRFIGEEENKRIALLVAASRLLDKPLGAIIRGEAGCGKSALIQAVCKTLPPPRVLYFSRMTAQSLYFIPKSEMQHTLLCCDEYGGFENQLALRSLMSSQSLSLAITIREGGRVPVTRTVEIPATVAVLVSTTGAVNTENLSRFVEIRLDSSTDQNNRVMQALARERQGNNGEQGHTIRTLQNASQLLRPCTVRIPYADSLIYKSGNVLARRQLAQVLGLISARAALHQYQRETEEQGSTLVVMASKADYDAVYPLLGNVVDHFEDDVSPAALALLEAIQKREAKTLTRNDVMGWMGWTYSRAYRTLQELTRLDLLIPDALTNGVKRVYEAAPYFKTAGGISHIAPPDQVG